MGYKYDEFCQPNTPNKGFKGLWTQSVQNKYAQFIGESVIDQKAQQFQGKESAINNYNRRLVGTIGSGLLLKSILSYTQTLQPFTINLKRGFLTILKSY